jgi:hypothetical protein
MSFAGLISFHTIAVMLRGDQPPSLDSGWEAVHSLKRDLDLGIQEHLKLLGVQPNVDELLERVGFRQYLKIHDDLEMALASC